LKVFYCLQIMNSNTRQPPHRQQNPHHRHPQRPASSHYPPQKKSGNITGYQQQQNVHQHTSHKTREPTKPKRPWCVVNQDDIPWKTLDDPENPLLNNPPMPHGMGGRFKSLSTASNNRKRATLGCSLCEVEPGYALYPFHSHATRDEAIYIIDGVATLRWGRKKIQVSTGDYINLPANLETPHQLINTGNILLRYLVLDRKQHDCADIVSFPDSQKTGCLAYTKRGPRVRFFRDATQTGYFEGEEGPGQHLRETSRLPQSRLSALVRNKSELFQNESHGRHKSDFNL